MSRRNRENLLLVGISLLGALALGVAVWAVAEADEEPTASTLAVAELDAAADGSASGRLEIVETGDRVWLKLQVRGVTLDDANLVITSGTDGTDSEAVAIAVPVDGEGDYAVTDEVPHAGAARIQQGDAIVLAGTLEPSD